MVRVRQALIPEVAKLVRFVATAGRMVEANV